MLTVPLYPDQFTPVEREVLRYDEFLVSAFRYPSGVEALRIANSAGEAIALPFQGQQIWDLSMFGRRQTMRSMFDQPRSGVPFLETYGGFLIHCGFSAMGGPGPEDDHPLHGELPNIRYDEASLVADNDEAGPYIALTGSVEFARAFGPHYRATPEVRMYPKSGALRVIFEAVNMKKTPMEYMYLCHVNFRPVDDGELLYTAPCDPDHVRVRSNIPSHLTVSDAYRDFLADLRHHPEKQNRLAPDLPFDPEAVLFIDMNADRDGMAHAMQRHPTGEGDFVSYRPRELDHAVRWICRTADQDGLGIVLPATAEPDGYTAEKKKGNVKQLAPGERFRCDFLAGALSASAAQRYAAHIDDTAGGGGAHMDVVSLDAKSH